LKSRLQQKNQNRKRQPAKVRQKLKALLLFSILIEIIQLTVLEYNTAHSADIGGS